VACFDGSVSGGVPRLRRRRRPVHDVQIVAARFAFEPTTIEVMAGESHTPSAPAADEDLRVSPAEPDYTLISLPTSLRVPRFKGAFRQTHRLRSH
jgi:hypothetical protein